MTKTRFITILHFLLLPFSAAVVLLFSSLATLDVMHEISELMVPNHGPAVQLPSYSIAGQLGLLLVALGMVLATRSRIGGMLPRLVLALAAMMFCLAALGIGIGTLQLESAFHGLATAATMDPETLRQDVILSKIPLLFGWSCLLAAITMVFGALVVSAKQYPLTTSSLWRRPSFVVGALSLLLILLAVVWNLTSLLSLHGSLSGPQIEPSAIAGGVIGMTRSVLLSSVAMFGWTTLCVLMAIRKEDTPNIENPV